MDIPANAAAPVQHNRHTLILESLEESEMGVYTCAAKNNHGEVSSTLPILLSDAYFEPFLPIFYQLYRVVHQVEHYVLFVDIKLRVAF